MLPNIEFELRFESRVQTYKLQAFFLMNRLMQRLLSLPKPAVVVLALALMMLIGSVEYITGHDFALSAFYLVPICWACWAAGRRDGIMLAIAGAVTWFIADLESGLCLPASFDPVLERPDVVCAFPDRGFFALGLSDGPLRLEETVELRTARATRGNQGTQTA